MARNDLVPGTRTLSCSRHASEPHSPCDQRGGEPAAAEERRRAAARARAAAALAAAHMPQRMQAAADAARQAGTPGVQPAGPPSVGDVGRAALSGAGRGRGWARPCPDFAALHRAWAARLAAAARPPAACSPCAVADRLAAARACGAAAAAGPGAACLAGGASGSAPACGACEAPAAGAGGGLVSRPLRTAAGGASPPPSARRPGRVPAAAGCEQSAARAQCKRAGHMAQRRPGQAAGQGLGRPLDLGCLDTQGRGAGRGCAGACLAALQRNFAALRQHVRAELRAEALAAGAAKLRRALDDFSGPGA